ncbi:hypothetical protein [Streptomyces sp. Root1310]|uniref:hypothetical protein n=1 Tax=Streptomyces sp. Root1310 TaxID=1736452 RepID=UPI00070D38B2|nr:hypothetical protein [Streptomyces sp. Root1310]KQX82268.1 hypothetical protein ASD48_02930 [Streptomyces sp. Root1310]
MFLPIRILRRPAALAASVAALFATAVAPAAADGSEQVVMRFETPQTYVMYNADQGAAASNSDFPVPVFVERSKGGEPARNVRVVVDASGLGGVARLGEGGMCKAEGPLYTCEYGNVQNGDGESYNPLALLGVDGVEPGDSGTVTYTATADNAPTITGTTRMTVGGPTLSAPGQEKGVSGLAPGKSANLTARLANNTRFPTEAGVALQVNASEGVTLTALHSNCFYAGPAPTSAWCAFPTKAAAGAAYRTGAPLVYALTPPGRLSGEVTYTWSSPPSRPADHTVRGTGAPLTLVRTAPQHFDDTHGRLGITTTVQVDYRPVTATVRGRVGDTVKVRLGLEDLGPGRVRGEEDQGRFEVVPPEGTTVTSIPYVFEEDEGKWACARPEKPDGAFVCEIGHDGLYEVRHEGGTTAIDFHIRIDRQVRGAEGTIRTYNPFDRTPANDVGVIPLDASPASPYRFSSHPWAWTAGALVVVILAAAYLRRRRRNAKPS